MRLKTGFKSSVAAVAAVLVMAGGCDKAKDGGGGTGGSSSSPVPFVTTPTGIEMAVLPGGEFVMGDDSGSDDDQKPAHRVKISPFMIDRREVTQGSYQALAGSNPSRFKAADKPVEQVSWRAAIKYCNLRSLKENLKPCYNVETGQCNFDADGYRLPTEAEWEYACRAGSAGPVANVGEQAWLKSNSGQTTHAVGQKKPNAWGLFDMLGNVAEWCNDRYGEKAYASSASADPRGPDSGEERVLRGGHWRAAEERCRPAARAGEAPGLADVCFGYDAYGFRCVRKAPAKTDK